MEQGLEVQGLSDTSAETICVAARNRINAEFTAFSFETPFGFPAGRNLQNEPVLFHNFPCRIIFFRQKILFHDGFFRTVERLDCVCQRRLPFDSVVFCSVKNAFHRCVCGIRSHFRAAFELHGIQPDSCIISVSPGEIHQIMLKAGVSLFVLELVSSPFLVQLKVADGAVVPGKFSFFSGNIFNGKHHDPDSDRTIGFRIERKSIRIVFQFFF